MCKIPVARRSVVVRDFVGGPRLHAPAHPAHTATGTFGPRQTSRSSLVRMRLLSRLGTSQVARTSISLVPFDIERQLADSLADSPTDGHIRPELADRQGACQEGAPCQDDPTAHPDAPCPLWCARSPPQQDGGPHVNAADSAAKGGPGSDEQTSMAGATGFCPAGFEFGGKKGAANEPTGVGAELRQPQPPPQVAAQPQPPAAQPQPPAAQPESAPPPWHGRWWTK